MGYRYRGVSRVTEKIKPKTLLIAAIAAFSLYIFYTATLSITGWLTRASSLETVLNETQNTLQRTNAERDRCETILVTVNKTLAYCEAERKSGETAFASCKAKTDELSTMLSTCETQTKATAGKLVSVQNDYELLVRSSVKDVCCRPGIEVAEWNISAGKIVCVGSSSINCTSGEVSFASSS
ncbi:MAG: hypothetical protein HYY37_02220 [Candidatus Aenigmarchaeota archaeon]|nr:hypothetical protein [Candidatus Aenigmarchaeota archaeon]